MLNIAIVSGRHDSYNNYKFNLKNNRFLELKKNRGFNIFNHDNLFLQTLHSSLKNYSIKIDHVYNYKNIEIIDIFFYIGISEHHDKSYIKNFKEKFFYLYINEPRSIISEQWENSTHHYFDRIFINNKKYLKKNNKNNNKYIYANGITVVTKNFKLENKKIKKYFSVLFAANRPIINAASLYKHKINLINYFEKNCPSELLLFGINWDINYFYKEKYLIILNKFLNYLKKINLHNFFFNKKKVYRGFFQNKIQKVSEAKFDFCIENSDYEGFLTGRIFHSFFAGTVPVYLGSKNIEKYIPNNTFVNFRKFKSIKSLHDYLSNMNNRTYNNYLKNIRIFLKSKKFYNFTLEHDVEIITKELRKYIR
jgi:hypothetical protein